MKQEYADWLQATKVSKDPDTGVLIDRNEINKILFEFQTDITVWSLARGRSAVFADTGNGKSLIILEWARLVPGRVLVLAPLAVALQLEDMANNMLGIEARYLRKDDGVTKVVIANYEMIDHFDPNDFKGVVCDESGILKNSRGVTRNEMIDWSKTVPFRLACSATPCPNEFTEILNTAEFLGVTTYFEALAMFFINDMTDNKAWRLKHHAEDKFWQWVASWAVFLNSPSDLGYPGDDFVLPKLTTEIHYVENDPNFAFRQGKLFITELKGLGDRREARKSTLAQRTAKVAQIIGDSKEPWIVWCDLNDEADALRKLLPQAIEVRGTDDLDTKIDNLLGFANGKYKQLITKPKIAGSGLNFQHCQNMIFCGLSDSLEAYYQSVRRCWRYGQKKPVNVHIVVSENEQTIVKNVARKEDQLNLIRNEVVQYTRKHVQENLKQGMKKEFTPYERDKTETDKWTMYKGDCIDVLGELPDESIHYSIFSPPFVDLYTFSDSEHDLSNNKNDDEFYAHFRFLIAELLRVMKSGRLVSVHCMQTGYSKYKDGFIGMRDFRGEIIRMFTEAGFIYASEVCIWKCPVVAMTRTKHVGLLHKTIKSDSAKVRQGYADYIVTFKKPGENLEKISHTAEQFPVDVWRNFASPVWTNINMTRTLQYRSARDNNDEKHVSPLQLDVIEACLDLWSNPGDVVLDPFMGIGSTGYASILKGRKTIGIELKESYYRAAVNNLTKIANSGETRSIFDNPIAHNWAADGIEVGDQDPELITQE